MCISLNPGVNKFVDNNKKTNFKDFFVAEEQNHIFVNRTQKRMDLALTLGNTQTLIDVTAINVINPSNGFIRSNGLSSMYFPRVASDIAAKKKWEKYRFLINHDNQMLVPLLLKSKGGGVTVHDSCLNNSFR